MNSKEALKTILINCKDLLVDKNGNVVKLEDLIKTIKQDLDRLEMLEKENKKLLVDKNVAQGIAKNLKTFIDLLNSNIGIEFHHVPHSKLYSMRIGANIIPLTKDQYNSYKLFLK